MFSCCRANSKNSQAKLTKKDKRKQTNENDDGAENQKESNNEKKFIIPTINIENGKVNERCDEIPNAIDESQIEDAKQATEESPSSITLEKSSEPNVANEASDAATHDAENDENKRKNSTTTEEGENNVNSDINTATEQNKDSESDSSKNDESEIIPVETLSTDDAVEPPPKSCLSRHNSTHTSIKKKVNISTRAEIIEPEPLSLPPYHDHASLGDDDEVFSDSLPPPKRDSMCAPYIDRDNRSGDEISETIAFAHGLPEWFENERISDMCGGCVEPPVTPVGRDELEMKRQRLYADLLRAAHAAVEHSIRFTPLSASESLSMWKPNLDVHVPKTTHGGDCDPDLKSSVAENLEILVNRLERLVERLERSVSARELEIANRTFDTVLEKKRESFDLESTELPPLPVEECFSENLNQRIELLETTLNRINSHSRSHSASISQNCQFQQLKEGSLENIPTVLDEYQEEPLNMSISGYQDIINGSLSQYLTLSNKIGGDVAKQSELVKQAFNAQLEYVTLATKCSQPSQDKQMALLVPTSKQITAIQDFREKNRTSPHFNHLSAISESIPALGWVCVSPTPGPHVKEMNDAGQFYTNRVLKEWKEKDTTHVDWARAWILTLTELQAYIKQNHTTGLVWSGKGVPSVEAQPPAPPMGCPPPPPPPSFDLGAMSLDSNGTSDDRSALFAEINQGEGITRNLKKVSAEMQTHKNPTLRTGPAPFKTPTQFEFVQQGATVSAVVKEPVFARDGKKWLIEYQKNNTKLLVDSAEMNNVIYMFKCEASTLIVKGKINNIVMDSCKKCSLLFDAVVASVEFVNCQSVQMQVLGNVPTIIIDKTDGCQMYLSKDSLGVEIVNSKSSEMNVMLPEPNGEYTELAMPEQYKTTISGKTLKTVCVDSLG